MHSHMHAHPYALNEIILATLPNLLAVDYNFLC